MKKTPAQLQEQNLGILLKNGPGLRYDYSTFVAGRDREAKKVLEGGLGGMGVGQMWRNESDHTRGMPGFDDAPEVKYYPDPNWPI